MSEPINIQDMIDGRLDIKSLGEAANGDENTTVVTRTGATYPSAKKAIAQMFEAGGLPATPFATKALMTASVLTDGKYAMVTNDTVAANNGLYIKTTGTWIKAAYDPLSQSKVYADTVKSAAIAQSATYSDTKAEISDDLTLLLNLKDAVGKSIITVDARGAIQIPNIDGTLQNAVNAFKNSLVLEDDTLLAKLSDKSGNNVLLIDSAGGIHASGVKGTLQSAITKLSKGSNASGIPLEIEGERIVGKAVYARAPKDMLASGYQWKLDGADITGANTQLYILKPGDVNKKLTVFARELKDVSRIYAVAPSTIGGVAIGDVGKAGTLYEGYVLSAGDDFNELDIIAPHRPLGRWFTTRTYLAGARGSDTLLGTMYDTDPYHLGFNDSNRGVPVGYNNMSVDDSVITLNSRVASSYEKKHFQGSNRNEVAAMISSVGAFSMYAGAASGGENILEFRVRHSNRDTNPNGWHPTLWTQSSLPSVTYNSDEWDISEGNSQYSMTNYNRWGADGRGTPDGGSYGMFSIFDGEWHTVTAIFSHDKFELYLDGAFKHQVLRDSNFFNEPAYALVSSHIYNGNFSNDIYDKAKWDAMVKGATQEVDYIRLWRRAGKSHIKPLVTINPINITYGATGTITLPSKMDLWGRTDVLEHVQTVMTEENEPGGHNTQAYNSLPSFITYDDLTRTATINTAGQKSGRLNFVIYGYLQDGSTCEPARTYANVAPRIDVTTINMAANTTYDLYAKCDCGVLVTDGVKRTKVINVSGLPVNASYNDNTGLIYSNDAIAGSYPLTVQCINSVGQSTTKTINLIVT